MRQCALCNMSLCVQFLDCAYTLGFLDMYGAFRHLGFVRPGDLDF